MSKQTRRTFLKRAATTAGVATGLTIAGTKTSGRVIGANDTVRVGVVGINGRGRAHIDALAKMKGVQVTHLVDPDSRLFESRSESVKKRGGNTPKCFQDIREALADNDLDAISVATCNHWHSLITIWGCQAGKDVYVEKPCSHNVFEGRKCVEAARKYERIVQHGSQSRAAKNWAKQTAAVKSGKYGKLLVAKGYCCKVRWSIGYKEPKDPPKELDYNLWLGPAPMQPYHENLVHYNWHWFWDTGNGDMGNQGVHQVDLCRWAIPGGTLPKSVVTLGGRWVETPDYKDQGETPNMELSVFDYGDTLLVFETRGLTRKKGPNGTKVFPFKVDVDYYLEEGKIIGGKFYPNGSDKGELLGDVDYHVEPGGIFKNFIDCVRSRNREKLCADILEAHYSSALCHLGNISYRLGKQVPFGDLPEEFGNNRQTKESFDMIKENLVGALGMDLGKETYQLGPKLEFDVETEKFVDNARADKLLTRDYRKPFVVPDVV